MSRITRYISHIAAALYNSVIAFNQRHNQRIRNRTRTCCFWYAYTRSNSSVLPHKVFFFFFFDQPPVFSNFFLLPSLHFDNSTAPSRVTGRTGVFFFALFSKNNGKYLFGDISRPISFGSYPAVRDNIFHECMA